MTIALIERLLSEIDHELQGAIHELIGGEPAGSWERKLENAADLFLKLKAECDPLPSTSSIKGALNRIAQKTRAVGQMLEQAARLHCGARSRVFVTSGEYASSGLMQPASSEPAVRLRA